MVITQKTTTKSSKNCIYKTSGGVEITTQLLQKMLLWAIFFLSSYTGISQQKNHPEWQMVKKIIIIVYPNWAFMFTKTEERKKSSADILRTWYETCSFVSSLWLRASQGQSHLKDHIQKISDISAAVLSKTTQLSLNWFRWINCTVDERKYRHVIMG